MRTIGLGAEKGSVPSTEKLLERIADLEKENAELKKELDSLKKKSKTTDEKKEKSDQSTVAKKE